MTISIAKRVVNNIFWLFVSQVCTKVLTFTGTLYLARVLGVEGYGLYSLALAVAAYIWIFADMGVTPYGTREVARDTGKAKELLNTLNSLRIVLAFGSFLILGSVLFMVNIPNETRWIILTGSFYVLAYAFSPEWLLVGIERIDYIAIGNIVVGTTFLGSIYFLVTSPADTVAATSCYSLAFFLGSLATLLILKTKVKIGFSFEFSPSKWWPHIKESWYFAVCGGLATIGIFIPMFFMGAWASNEEMGLFSAPHRLIVLIIRTAAIIAGAFYPILSSLYFTDKDKFQQTHRVYQRLILYIGLPVAILGMVLSEDIIGLLFGDSYLRASDMLEIMIWLIPLTLLRNNYRISLRSAGFQKHSMVASIIGAITIIISCVFFVPNYAGQGAAFALIGGEILTLLSMGLMFAVKLYPDNPFDSYLTRVAAASIAMGLTVSAIDVSALPKIASGVGMYGIFSLLLGLISRENIQKLTLLIRTVLIK